MDWQKLNPPQALRLRYLLEARLTAPGSTSGLVAERCKLGLATREPYQGDGASGVRAELADLMLCCRDLTPLEQRVCRLRYGPATRSVGYERLVRIGDLREGDGEDVIDAYPRDLGGQPLGGGWVRVRGVKARMPSHMEIAQRLALDGVRNSEGQPMTHGAVERRLRDASAKISWPSGHAARWRIGRTGPRNSAHRWTLN